jgi:hypothetical protein
VTLGRPAVEGGERALVERLLEVVVPAYVARIDLAAVGEPFLGLSLVAYWDGSDPSHWTPPPLAITERAAAWAIAHGEVASLWMYPDVGAVDLEGPKGYGDAALREPGQALLDAIERDNAYELVDVYFEALAERLHAALGVPVAYERTDGSGAMGPPLVRAQLGPEVAAEWEARGWLPPASGPRRPVDPSLDVVLSVALDDGRTAGIWRSARGRFLSIDVASGGGTGVDRGGRVVVAGDDRVAVAGGVVPEGAAAARVEDLRGGWHDARVVEDVWLCALPHGGRGPAPRVEFTDALGAVVAPPARAGEDEGDGEPWMTLSVELPGIEASGAELEALQRRWAAEAAARDAAVLAGARTPVLWDDALGTAPALSSYDDDDAATSISLVCGRTTVETEITEPGLLDDPEREARDLLEHHLWRPDGDLRATALAVMDAVPTPLPTTLDGQDQTFLLLTGGGGWAAVWADPRTGLRVQVTGDGDPPARLDLARRPTP